MLTPQERIDRIAKIRTLPDQLRALVDPLSAADLARHQPGEWNTRQIVHHLADSHMNAVIRFKLALTEDRPTIKTYHQELWAELIDGHDLPIDSSLAILSGLHTRWVALLESLTPEQWAREFIHPESGRKIIDDLLVTYSDHGEIHLAQIKSALAASG